MLSIRTGNWRGFEQSGLVRYIEGNDLEDAVKTLSALMEDEKDYNQLRSNGNWVKRTWEDAGREFLDWLERDS